MPLKRLQTLSLMIAITTANLPDSVSGSAPPATIKWISVHSFSIGAKTGLLIKVGTAISTGSFAYSSEARSLVAFAANSCT